MSAPSTIARRSPNRSAIAAKIGCPKPQARFWMAMASENSARGQPNCSEMGIWNSPKLARMPKPTSRITQLATRTGVKSGVLLSVMRGCWSGAGAPEGGAAGAEGQSRFALPAHHVP